MTKKRVLTAIIAFIAGALAICLIIGFTGGRFALLIPGVNSGGELKAGSIPLKASGSELVAASYEILDYIKNGEYEKISKISHRETGVLFSPYATISATASRVFSASEIKSLGRDKQSYVWGVFDGSGEPIDMTPNEYFTRFVFDRDFTTARQIGVDTVVRSGNSLENITEVFPEMRFVDFYTPSTTADDLGWKSLRLGFLPYDDCLMLSLILHSEYTI